MRLFDGQAVASCLDVPNPSIPSSTTSPGFKVDLRLNRDQRLRVLLPVEITSQEQGHELAQVRYQVRDGEDEIRCIAVLRFLPF